MAKTSVGTAHRHKDQRGRWSDWTDEKSGTEHTHEYEPPAPQFTPAEVTALKAILAAGGGGGGTTPVPNPPPAPPPDITAPTVSGVSATGITTTSATINATTDEAATVQVEYSTTGIWPGTLTAATSSGTSHSRTLSGLTPGQVYVYRVRATDTAGNLRLDQDRTFTTTASPTLPGAPTNLVATGANTAVGLTWVAPASNGGSAITGYRVYRNGASLIVLGVVLSYNNTGLTNGQTYTYTVAAITAVGEGPQSGSASATPATSDITAPTISNVQFTPPTTTGVTISWTTNEAATGYVRYGITASYGSQTAATSSGTTHSRTLTGLTPNTLYHVGIVATDTAGNVRQDGDRSFTTAAVIPTPVVGVQGFGKNATGGTGQTTVHVTNLNDSGAGSFRAALGSNRTIVFDVAGTITFPSSSPTMTGLSNFTIDGSAKAITFRGWPVLIVGCDNFIVKNLRFRDQDRDGTGDCLTIKDGCTNFVVDHCSLTGGSDGCLDITSDCTDGTVQWCILGDNGATALNAFDVANITHHHNLYYAGGSRMPQFSSNQVGSGLAGDVRCNLIWAPASGIYGTLSNGNAKVNAVRNYYYLAPGRTGVNYAVHTETGGTAFSSGNFDKRGGSTATSFPASEFAVAADFQITMEATAQLAAEAVVAGAGCRVGGLDSGDQARINNVLAGL